jgi:ubiquitin C-terminal hydrolase
MWLCSGCQNKVRATKEQQYSQLPQAVMIHLKRFRYDPVRATLFTPAGKESCKNACVAMFL